MGIRKKWLKEGFVTKPLQTQIVQKVVGNSRKRQFRFVQKVVETLQHIVRYNGPCFVQNLVENYKASDIR